MADYFAVPGPRYPPNEIYAYHPTPIWSGPSEGGEMYPSERPPGPITDFMPYFNRMYRTLPRDVRGILSEIPIDWRNTVDTDELKLQVRVALFRPQTT